VSPSSRQLWKTCAKSFQNEFNWADWADRAAEMRWIAPSLHGFRLSGSRPGASGRRVRSERAVPVGVLARGPVADARGGHGPVPVAPAARRPAV